MPEKIPQLKLRELELLLNKSYQERAIFLINLFQTDFPEQEIKRIINTAYPKKNSANDTNFDNEEIAPLTHLKANQFLQELWHGPTSAFKDMALQVMPLFFESAIKKNGSVKFLILTATSGDTGKAALEGFKNKAGTSIAVFYPNGLVSKIQQLQMETQGGENVLVCAVKSDFDGVQKLVKELFGDQEFNENLKLDFNTQLSSANSINWGRLMPQIIYHISGYLDLVSKGVIKLGQEIDIAVPTGNFGNILAAFYAKKMGLPVARLICASNENNVLTEFLQTGIYDIKSRKLVKTPSPSMDILIASNIERLLYELSGDSELVLGWMRQLKEEGRFEVGKSLKAKLQEFFFAGFVSNEDCLGNIKKTFEETGYLMDPHTSVAQKVTEEYLDKSDSRLPVVICATAHWAKFANQVYKALFPNQPIPGDEFEALKKIRNTDVKLSIPEQLIDLKEKKPLHKTVIDVSGDQSKEMLMSFLKKL